MNLKQINQYATDLAGVQDNILLAFMHSDFKRVLELADFGEAAFRESKKTANTKSNPTDFDTLEELNGIDCVFEGSTCLYAIVASALAVAKSSKALAKSKVSKQALYYATILHRRNKSKQITHKNHTQNVFYDFILGSAYAANGDVKEAKDILSNLAKPYLDCELDFNSNALKSSSIDSSANMRGGGNTLKSSTKSTQQSCNTSKTTTQKNSTSSQPILSQHIPPFFARYVLCALAEIHTALDELESAENIYRAILHSDYLLSLGNDFSEFTQDIWLSNGTLDNNYMRPIESLWRLYEKGDEKKSLSIFYEILERLESILASLQNTNEQIPFIDPYKHLFHIHQPLHHRLVPMPKTIGKNDKQITQLRAYIDSIIRPGIAYYLDVLYRNKDALNLYKELEPLNQNNSNFFNFYGTALANNHYYEEAYNAFLKSNSIANNSNALFGCGLLLLQICDNEETYKQALAFYEHRLNLLDKDNAFSPQHYQKAYNDLQSNPNAFEHKIIVVYGEQGYGDSMMFSNALTKLCGIAKEVLFMPQTGLFRLFSTSLESIRIHNPNNPYKNLKIMGTLPRDVFYNDLSEEEKTLKTPPTKKQIAHQVESARISYDFDYAVPICSLPFLLNMGSKELQILPRPIAPISYLRQSLQNNEIATPTSQLAMTEKRDCHDFANAKSRNDEMAYHTDKNQQIKKKIGIFWHTNSSNNYYRYSRNIPLEIITNGLKDTPYGVVSFQIVEEIKGKKEEFNIPEWIESRGENLSDWQDTYENLWDIDMIISIDSAFAHFGLALGIPTLVLLPLRFEWRWGKTENPSSFIYPQAHLLVFDSNQHKGDLIKRNKHTSKAIANIAKKVLG